ncbi:hypothetical protein IEQ34_014786 [Dendrobium chrysotoxum]|uniref:Uncharacterized protein n=1 Tax=Dendrobium chrysotoxum TaxID=161865 RepID=A0AAV7GML1_DENCH|nr:hypothetical protein IEQ34_014786 [Dendrobium chrysotoxum]
MFEGIVEPRAAEDWLKRLEKIFDDIQYPLERKAPLTVFILDGSRKTFCSNSPRFSAFARREKKECRFSTFTRRVKKDFNFSTFTRRVKMDFRFSAFAVYVKKIL